MRYLAKTYLGYLTKNASAYDTDIRWYDGISWGIFSSADPHVKSAIWGYDGECISVDDEDADSFLSQLTSLMCTGDSESVWHDAFWNDSAYTNDWRNTKYFDILNHECFEFKDEDSNIVNLNAVAPQHHKSLSEIGSMDEYISPTITWLGSLGGASKYYSYTRIHERDDSITVSGSVYMGNYSRFRSIDNNDTDIARAIDRITIMSEEASYHNGSDNMSFIDFATGSLSRRFFCDFSSSSIHGWNHGLSIQNCGVISDIDNVLDIHPAKSSISLCKQSYNSVSSNHAYVCNTQSGSNYIYCHSEIVLSNVGTENETKTLKNTYNVFDIYMLRGASTAFKLSSFITDNDKEQFNDAGQVSQPISYQFAII